MEQPYKHIQQGTLFWKAVREYCGITASEVGDLFGMGYLSPNQRFLSKIGMGKKENNNNNKFVKDAREHGTRYEPEACRILETVLKCRVDHYGLFLHPTLGYDFAGSPDGIVVEQRRTLVEIKCPYFVPSDEVDRKPYDSIKLGHLIQMIGLMECCDCDEAIYMSFAVPKDGNLLNTKYRTWIIQRQTEIWEKFILPEIRNFLEAVKFYYETPSTKPTIYRGASKECRSKLMQALHKLT